MSHRRSIILFACAAMISGCLKTRTDVRETEERQAVQSQVTVMQKNNADALTRFSEMDEDMRGLRGRVEVLENTLSKKESDLESQKKAYGELNSDATRKLMVLQEEVGKLSAQVAALQAEMAGLRAEKSAGEATKSSQTGTWETAQKFVNEKEWKKAILSLQKYRDENPKGRHLPLATYYMGVSFQELNMDDEAKTFFEELISKYPSSTEAKKAKARMKSSKK